mmetsp:Transcript_18469/g.52123  ORF Transcript_18469/g.52123 Transcript_18469/m.52123 type:complete len:102 (+) Transcript_18469:2207-2512(+)
MPPPLSATQPAASLPSRRDLALTHPDGIFRHSFTPLSALSAQFWPRTMASPLAERHDCTRSHWPAPHPMQELHLGKNDMSDEALEKLGSVCAAAGKVLKLK